MRRLLPLLLLLIPLAGCYGFSKSSGGGQTSTTSRRINPADIALPAGYRIELVAKDLTFPTGVTFDDQNRPVIIEAGYSYGEKFTTPRLLRIEQNGATTVLATGDNSGPWNGVAFHNNAFYIAQGGEQAGGRIARITLPTNSQAQGFSPGSAKQEILVDHLPSMGDHHVNGPVISKDGAIYFSIGTATNSGVVGTDNYEFGWLQRHPDFHDTPPRDIKLTGQSFTTDNPLTPEKNDKATTGAYQPFGTPSQPGQTIKGKTPGSGAIYRITPKPTSRSQAEPGGPPPDLTLVAWGLRNPFGLALAPDGSLYVTENQFDDRGSRPLWGTGDLLWKITPNTWYGWPDFWGPYPVTNKRVKPPRKDQPQFLLAQHPNPPQKPAAVLPVHAGAGGLDFSRSDRFGYAGQAFIAIFGDMAPNVGKVMGPVGFRVVRVDPANGSIETFATNRGKENGPASQLKTGGLERPVACRFDNTGEALYVVDFGILNMIGKPRPQERTGVLWRITREAR
ncbi:MAG TPA: hypothetical protein VF669_00045 [Tepidisphaeraceae bacterium]|jgi:glucose/arabinose dehydrogenase